MRKKIEMALREYFVNYKAARLVFLMGSYAKGTARDESDVDVAVLFDQFPDANQVTNLREALTLLLRKDVDLVLLNSAGPVIRMQALKNGLIIHRGKNAYEEYFTRTLNEYSDLKFFRKEAEEKILGRRIYA